MTGKVILVDDEAAMRRSVEQWLTLSDIDVVSLSDGREALELLSDDFEGVIVSDVKMPKIDGLALMERIHEIDQQIPVILMTGHCEVAMAVEAMKKSAYDFMEKP